MENYAIVIFILAVMIGLSAVADRIKIPYPILLIIAGIAVGFVPSLPPIDINPEIIFLIFLPPLLYDAAFKAIKVLNLNASVFLNFFQDLSRWLVLSLRN
ncbi:cation:proton antiporter [Pedobacter borealis]|uniref:cation:proton antiporter domain-containing protein n=1 Tax=Pedobacter borealis TaxID=475254 RepID=UPI0004932B63|nr:cation:proton antiporter [Pedobacter borealis]